MNSEFLNRISFTAALDAEQVALEAVRSSGESIVLGFECESTVTLGIRAGEHDLVASLEAIKQHGYVVTRVDRGGQATIHCPGQLVVFPIVPIHHLGARKWICHLARTTVRCLSNYGIESYWDEKRPGVYTQAGKIAAIGVRIRSGISTHGISINVSNELGAFQMIRSCGVAAASVDKISNYLPKALSLPEVFEVWLKEYAQNRSECDLP